MTALSGSGDTKHIVAALQSHFPSPEHAPPQPSDKKPNCFITIARLAGAGGTELAKQLAQRLNADRNDEPPWQSYDKELIEKVAQDHKLDKRLIAELQDAPRTWLNDFLDGIPQDKHRPSDDYVYEKVVATIRLLAKNGNAIIVGRGGMLCTQDIPGGIHLNLTAPKDYRAKHTAKSQNITENEAAKWIDTIDKRRKIFFNRYWPNLPNIPDAFMVTMNTAKTPLEQQIEIAMAMVNNVVSENT